MPEVLSSLSAPLLVRKVGKEVFQYYDVGVFIGSLKIIERAVNLV